MGTEMALETLTDSLFNHLTRLSASGSFNDFISHKNFRLCLLRKLPYISAQEMNPLTFTQRLDYEYVELCLQITIHFLDELYN